MAEHTLEALSPLHAWADRFATLAPAVVLGESPVAQAIVRTDDPDTIARLDLPGACRLRRNGDEVALWLGPDEWLLYRPRVPGHDYLAEIGAAVGRDATRTFLLDASGQRTRLLLSGPRADTVLAHGCAVNFAPAAFGADDVAQTLFAQTGIIVHRTDDGFALLVRSSFADYLAHWLIDASAEYSQCGGPQ